MPTARLLLLCLAAAGLAACDTWHEATGDKPNPFLQSAEGRAQIIQRCNAKAAERWPDAGQIIFARGQLASDSADYVGAVEVVSQAGISQRFRFACQVQPDGAVSLQFL